MGKNSRLYELVAGYEFSSVRIGGGVRILITPAFTSVTIFVTIVGAHVLIKGKN
jgi:hypothetical protein